MTRYNHFGIDVSQRVVSKFWDFVGKQRIPAGRTLEDLLLESKKMQLTYKLRQAICHVLKLRDPKNIWVRSRQVSNTFTIVFIGSANRLEEICGWRALRQMAKRWQHHMCELGAIDSPYDGETFHTIFKYRRTMKIQGGLLRQEKQPKDRWN